jgi:putative tricarboxylic transport membrane protein
MDTFILLFQGFSNALSLQNLFFALLGSILGTMVGVLPGLGPTAGIAILLPVTNWLPPIPAIIMLGAIFYGAMYGGSTTSILINVPGEVSSVVTCMDGYQMAKQGRAAPALAISAIASWIAGTLGLIGLTFFSPPLAGMALRMGPPEIFGLIIFSLSMVVSMSGKSLLKGIASGTVGILIGMVGMDPTLGRTRFCFGSAALMGGIDLIAAVMGLFAMNEVFKNIGEKIGTIYSGRLPPWYRMITWSEIKQSLGAIVRSTGVGFFLGCLPGMTPGVVTFMAYDLEKKVSKNRRNFGKGAIEGVAAPEGANNACSTGNFVPMLTLGIPPSTSIAVLLGGLMIYGLQPGPLLFEKEPVFVWTVISSMYIGNVMLLILNLPLVGIWARLVRVPYKYIASVILLFCFIGTYTVRNSFFDVATCLVFGFVGSIMDRVKISPLPLILGLILGDILENSLRQTLAMAGGSLGILWSRPIALVLIGAGLLSTIIVLYARSRSAKTEAYLGAADGQ